MVQKARTAVYSWILQNQTDCDMICPSTGDVVEGGWADGADTEMADTRDEPGVGQGVMPSCPEWSNMLGDVTNLWVLNPCFTRKSSMQLYSGHDLPEGHASQRCNLYSMALDWFVCKQVELWSLWCQKLSGTSKADKNFMNTLQAGWNNRAGVEALVRGARKMGRGECVFNAGRTRLLLWPFLGWRHRACWGALVG